MMFNTISAYNYLTPHIYCHISQQQYLLFAFKVIIKNNILFKCTSLNVTPAVEIQGAIRTAGGGCWIHVQHCPRVTHGENTMIYDGWGATNLNTGTYDKH